VDSSLLASLSLSSSFFSWFSSSSFTILFFLLISFKNNILLKNLFLKLIDVVSLTAVIVCVQFSISKLVAWWR
jgi:hypothetical protein